MPFSYFLAKVDSAFEDGSEGEGGLKPRDTGESEITLWIWKLRAIHGR